MGVTHGNITIGISEIIYCFYYHSGIYKAAFLMQALSMASGKRFRTSVHGHIQNYLREYAETLSDKNSLFFGIG